MSDIRKNFCPRLLDYLVIAGCRNAGGNNNVSQTPELLRRYPVEDHHDFPLPNDVIFFCQPEGCISVGPKCRSLRDTSSFVFTLTEKDTGLVRYGMCINFYRPFDRKSHPLETWSKTDRSTTSLVQSTDSISSMDNDQNHSTHRSWRKPRIRNNTLTSLCLVSHHPFFSKFRECLMVLRCLIEACHDRSCVKRVGGSKITARDSVWGVLTGQVHDNISSLIMHDVREIETWILRLLSAPVPVPGKTRVEIVILPVELHLPLLFALPDSTRFSLVDFPLHLPLELLGVETCLKVLTAIMLENKVILQSRDYNALSMSVLAFVYMLYPLEYMFPIIPLLPTCMASAEQLLLAPTPYLIGVPATFLGYKKDFPFPDDVWLVDLDSNKIRAPSSAEPLPPLPEPEGTTLKTNLNQALSSLSMATQAVKNLDVLAPDSDHWQQTGHLPAGPGYKNLIFGNDEDSVDIAVRVALVRFFTSPNVLGNFSEHTRTLRLYPRPVVAFQFFSFLKSRPEKSSFISKLARTQAVEYLAEWSLCPTNSVYQRVAAGTHDPSLVGDKPKWYAHQLQLVEFHVYDNSSSLGPALQSMTEEHSDDVPTDESGSDSDGAESNSSSYSSLSDFVSDLYNSDIHGETPSFAPEKQVLAVDESKVYSPPSRLLVPDTDPGAMPSSDSALCLQDDCEMTSSASSQVSFGKEPQTLRVSGTQSPEEMVFRYDSGNVADLSQSSSSSHHDGLKPATPLSTSPVAAPVGRTLSAPHSPKISPTQLPLNFRNSLPLSPRELKMTIGNNASISNKILTEDGSQGDKSSPSSKLFTITGELSSLAQQASSNVSEMFHGSNRSPSLSPQPKPFSPLGTRKVLVEKSTLTKQPVNKRQKEPPRTDIKPAANSEHQQLLKETVTAVLEGKGWNMLKERRIKKLMETEDYRNFVVSRLNQNLDKRLPEDAAHIEDVCVSKMVHKGMLGLLKAIVHGLDHTIANHGLGGMASAYMLLEIAHTHYWSRDSPTSNKSDGSLTPEKTSLHGSHDSLEPPGLRKLEERNTSDWWLSRQRSSSQSSSALTSPRTPYFSPLAGVSVNAPATSVHSSESFTSGSHTDSGSPANGPDNGSLDIISPTDERDISSSELTNPVIRLHSDQLEPPKKTSEDPSQVNDGTNDPRIFHFTEDQYTDTSIINSGQKRPQSQTSCDITITDTVPDCQIHHLDGDMLRDMVRNKDLIKTGRMERKFKSEDSEMSEASTLVSTRSERDALARRRHHINQQSIRSALSDSEMETSWPGGSHGRRRGPASIWNTKSTFTSGYRYRDGTLLHTGTAGLTAESAKNRTYIFEGLVDKSRSLIWDNMQFWEDMFLDAVAQERDIIGMDQKPPEMMERYNSLGEADRKRLEFDEDRLLSVMLFNLTAFMLMMRVAKFEIKKKIRRLLGKSHIGLQQSQDINSLLDNIDHLHGNDIDLKPMSSRRVNKQSFFVHWGTNNKGDMLFMEVYDDCLLLRNVMGTIHDRWWFEKLINMTFCPKTRVLNLWRMCHGQLQLSQFYSKKGQKLYASAKEAMDRLRAKFPAQKIEGEFSVQDLKTQENGKLQICKEGINLVMQNSRLFIDVARIKKCSTKEHGVLVLEERDSKSTNIIQHKFASSQAYEIVLLFHRMLSVLIAKAPDVTES